MITESWPWRRSLGKTAARIRQVTEMRSYRSDTLDLLERELMVGFFSIRKLIDTRSKIPKSISEQIVRLGRAPCVKPIGAYERFEFYEHYDLCNTYSVKKNLGYVSNQIIHSLVFSFGFSESGRLEDIFFVSDKDRLKFCNFIALNDVASLFELVALSESSKSILRPAEDGGRELISSD